MDLLRRIRLGQSAIPLILAVLLALFTMQLYLVRPAAIKPLPAAPPAKTFDLDTDPAPQQSVDLFAAAPRVASAGIDTASQPLHRIPGVLWEKGSQAGGLVFEFNTLPSSPARQASSGERYPARIWDGNDRGNVYIFQLDKQRDTAASR